MNLIAKTRGAAWSLRRRACLGARSQFRTVSVKGHENAQAFSKRARQGARARMPIVLSVLMMAISTAAAADTVVLNPGMAQGIALSADAEAAIVADPAVADVAVVDPRHIVVLGKAPGITSVDMRGAGGVPIGSYAVRVDAQTDHASQVVAHLAAGSGIQVDAVGGTLFVSGIADSPAQAARILEGVRAVSTGQVIDALELATPAQVSLEVLISEVSRSVANELGIDWSLDLNPFADVTRWIWDTGVRAGTGAYQLGRVIEQTIVRGDAAGRLVFELETEELGTQLSAVRGGEGGIVLSQTREVNSGKYRLTGFLDALARNGLVTVHARPSLTTMSGAPAEFFSGLEVPVPTLGDGGSVGTEYKQTGVGLSFTPTVLSRGQISLTVNAEVREVAIGGTTIGGAQVPNINERSAATTVELGDGESIAIAGLYRRATSSSDTGIPLLKELPVWGALFSSTAERDDSAELIIVVTPTIVAGVPGLTQTAQAGAGATARRIGNEFHY